MVATCVLVALVVVAAYEVLVHRLQRDWEECKVINVTYAQSLPTSGVITWYLMIFPAKGEWSFHGTRRLDADHELPPNVGRPTGEVRGEQTVDLKGTLRPEAASGLVDAVLERNADILGRWFELFAPHGTDTPLIVIEVRVDARHVKLANPVGVPSMPLEDLARRALTLTVLANSDATEADSAR